MMKTVKYRVCQTHFETLLRDLVS